MAGDTGGQAWLAQKLGISQPRVSKLVNSEGWTFGRGPWKTSEVHAIKSHLAARRSENNATAGTADETTEDEQVSALTRNPEKIARIKLLIERTAKIKLERELLAGGFIKKEDADKEAVAKVFSVRAKLQEIPLRASLVAHKSEAECERILSDWVREVCDYYANGGN